MSTHKNQRYGTYKYTYPHIPLINTEGETIPLEYTEEDLLSRWEQFYLDHTKAQIDELRDTYPKQHSLTVDFKELDMFDPEFTSRMLEKPTEVLDAGSKAALDLIGEKGGDVFIQVRVLNLPSDVEYDMKALRSDNLGKFITIEGLVKKATEVKHGIKVAYFKCYRCNAVVSQVQEGTTFSPPVECPKDQNGCGRTASSTKFFMLDDRCECIDTQKIEIQENPEALRGSGQPSHMIAMLRHELAGSINPGDRVIFNGTLKLEFKPKMDSNIVGNYFDVNSITISQNDYEEVSISDEDLERLLAESSRPGIIERIAASIAPFIAGYEVEKEGLALGAAGGMAYQSPSGKRFRGNIHILLVGDPGIAKSQLLQYMALMVPRSIYASGKSSTAAGLTAAAVKDEFGEGRWTIEAGALVLADKGMAAIDELDKMNENDKSSLHEAMESERISVNKAGISTTLNARTTVIAAANPKFGRFDETQRLVEQLEISDTLLSRFDLIFIMQDKVNEKKDTIIAEKMMATRKRAQATSVKASGKTKGMEADIEKILKETEGTEPVYDIAFLRKYFAYCKRVVPIFTEAAAKAVQVEYTSMRQKANKDNRPIPVTPRQLEAKIRLSEASARLRLSPRITLDDVKRAEFIVTYCYNKAAKNEQGEIEADLMFTGVSKGDRTGIAKIREIIFSAGTSGITEEELMVRGSEEQLPDAQIRKALKMLRDKSEVYEMAKGKFRVVGER